MNSVLCVIFFKFLFGKSKRPNECRSKNPEELQSFFNMSCVANSCHYSEYSKYESVSNPHFSVQS